jgi:hypothetical protein
MELSNETIVDMDAERSNSTLALGPVPQVVNTGIESLRTRDVNKYRTPKVTAHMLTKETCVLWLQLYI